MTNPTPPRDDAPDAALIEIVEGINGAMNHGTWRDDHGNRLKDTPEWVAFYNAALRAHQPARVGVDDDTLIAAMMAIEEGEAQFGWFEKWRESISDWKGEHCGDCTNVPMTCLRCTYDDAVKRLPDFSRILAALLPTEAGADERSRWWKGEATHVEVAAEAKRYSDLATPPAATTDNTALVEAAKALADFVRGTYAGDTATAGKRRAALAAWDTALSRPAPQAVTVEECLEAINQVKAEAQADLYGAKNDFNRGAVDAIDRAYARVRALGGRT